MAGEAITPQEVKGLASASQLAKDAIAYRAKDLPHGIIAQARSGRYTREIDLIDKPYTATAEGSNDSKKITIEVDQLTRGSEKNTYTFSPKFLADSIIASNFIDPQKNMIEVLYPEYVDIVSDKINRRMVGYEKLYLSPDQATDLLRQCGKELDLSDETLRQACTEYSRLERYAYVKGGKHIAKPTEDLSSASVLAAKLSERTALVPHPVGRTPDVPVKQADEVQQLEAVRQELGNVENGVITIIPGVNYETTPDMRKNIYLTLPDTRTTYLEGKDTAQTIRVPRSAQIVFGREAEVPNPKNCVFLDISRNSRGMSGVTISRESGNLQIVDGKLVYEDSSKWGTSVTSPSTGGSVQLEKQSASIESGSVLSFGRPDNASAQQSHIIIYDDPLERDMLRITRIPEVKDVPLDVAKLIAKSKEAAVQNGEDSGRKRVPEYSIPEVRKVWTIDDIRQLQKALAAQPTYMRIDEQEMGNFLRFGLFEPNFSVDLDLSYEGQRAYDDVLLTGFNKWREAVAQGAVGDKSRELLEKTFGSLDEVPRPETARALRRLYKEHPDFNKASGVSYQNGVPDSGSAYLIFSGSRINPELPKMDESTERVYVNPSEEFLPLIAKEFMARADAYELPYNFKFFDYSLPRPLQNTIERSDRMIFYSDRAHLSNVLGVLNEIRGEHPEWFAGRKPPMMTAPAFDNVGIASDVNDRQTELMRVRNRFRKNFSFTQVRSEFMNEVYHAVEREFMRDKGADYVVPGVGSLRSLFEEAFEHVERYDGGEYEEGKYIPNGKFEPQGLSESEESYFDQSLQEAVRGALPYIPPEVLSPLFTREIVRLAPEFDIDPNDLSRNLSA